MFDSFSCCYYSMVISGSFKITVAVIVWWFLSRKYRLDNWENCFCRTELNLNRSTVDVSLFCKIMKKEQFVDLHDSSTWVLVKIQWYQHQLDRLIDSNQNTSDEFKWRKNRSKTKKKKNFPFQYNYNVTN